MTQETGKTTTRRRFMTLLAATAGSLAALSALAGCGGSSGTGPGFGGCTITGTNGTHPTDATRARLQELSARTFQGIAASGAPLPLGIGFSGGGAVGGGDSVGGGGAAGTAGPGSGGVSVPNVGAFMQNVANQPPSRSTRAIRAMQSGRAVRGATRDVAPGPDVPPPPPGDGGEYPLPQPTFYFDEYLGLWVQTEYSRTEFTYRLFEDEAKTKPAGSIVTTQPADWNVYPQTYSSRYEFTAGYLNGAHGSYENTVNADYSGRSKYENVYADGGTNRGHSTSTGAGDFTYSDRTEDATGFWTESAGTFRRNGSGGTRTSSSDGYATDYTFNADGSGRGTIKGNLPGLPATITWDARGNTTIRWADGTTERISGWGYGFYGGGFGGGNVPIPIDGDGTGTATAQAKS